MGNGKEAVELESGVNCVVSEDSFLVLTAIKLHL